MVQGAVRAERAAEEETKIKADAKKAGLAMAAAVAGGVELVGQSKFIRGSSCCELPLNQLLIVKLNEITFQFKYNSMKIIIVYFTFFFFCVSFAIPSSYGQEFNLCTSCETKISNSKEPIQEINVKSSETINMKADNDSESQYDNELEYNMLKLDIVMVSGHSTKAGTYISPNTIFGKIKKLGKNVFVTHRDPTTEANSTLDLKIVRGGVLELSELDFLRAIGNVGQQKEIMSKIRTVKIKKIGGIVLIITGLYLAENSFQEKQTSDFGYTHSTYDINSTQLAFGIVTCIVGVGFTMVKQKDHYLDPQDISKQIFDYNRALRKYLNISFDYSPTRQAVFAKLNVNY